MKRLGVTSFRFFLPIKIYRYKETIIKEEFMLVLNQRSVYSDKVFEAGEVFTVASSEEKREALTKFFSTIEKYRVSKRYCFGHFSDGKKRFVNLDLLKVV